MNKSRNSVVEASLAFPNVGEYIAQLETIHEESTLRICHLRGALESIAGNACCVTCREAALVAKQALKSDIGEINPLPLGAPLSSFPGLKWLKLAGIIIFCILIIIGIASAFFTHP